MIINKVTCFINILLASWIEIVFMEAKVATDFVAPNYFFNDYLVGFNFFLWDDLLNVRFSEEFYKYRKYFKLL